MVCAGRQSEAVSDFLLNSEQERQDVEQRTREKRERQKEKQRAAKAAVDAEAAAKLQVSRCTVPALHTHTPRS